MTEFDFRPKRSRRDRVSALKQQVLTLSRIVTWLAESLAATNRTQETVIERYNAFGSRLGATHRRDTAIVGHRGDSLNRIND